MKTVIIFSHSYFENSVSNKAILEILQKEENLEIRHLEALYPDGNIDVEAEQKALVAADIIIFQHPFFWYNVPAMLKKWIDEVMAYGFAYGSEGDKLKGKKFIHSFTTGGPKEGYSSEGYVGAKVEDLILPIKQMARLVQLDYQKPVIAHGLNAMMNPNAKEQAQAHTQKIIESIALAKG